MSHLPPTTKDQETIAVRFTRWIGSTSSIVVHTVIFVLAFGLALGGVSLDSVLLILTTAVSLEAIYLAIFIQMSVNRQSETIEDVEKDIDEIQEDVDEIQKDVDEIQEDVDEIQEDVDDISVDIDVMHDESEIGEPVTLEQLHDDLKKLLETVDKLKQQGGK